MTKNFLILMLLCLITPLAHSSEVFVEGVGRYNQEYGPCHLNHEKLLEFSREQAIQDAALKCQGVAKRMGDFKEVFWMDSHGLGCGAKSQAQFQCLD